VAGDSALNAITIPDFLCLRQKARRSPALKDQKFSAKKTIWLAGITLPALAGGP
jgi:hypothetical protein